MTIGELDEVRLQAQVFIGQKEKLISVPDWQERFRAFVDELVTE